MHVLRGSDTMAQRLKSTKAETRSRVQRIIETNREKTEAMKRAFDKMKQRLKDKTHVYYRMQDLQKWILDCLENG